MQAKITSSRDDNKLRGKSIVYINQSPLDKVADRWYTENNISNLDFKCKTWSKIVGLTNKNTTPLLKKLFPEALSIKFSRKAGCRCGCSPGYIVRHEPNQYGCNFWVDIETTHEELELFTTVVNCAKYRQDLEKEISIDK